MSTETPSPQIPEDCDLGIITVIGVEIRQVLKAFEIPEKRRRKRGGVYYWETTVGSQNIDRNLKVVIGCIAKPGTVHAAVHTASFLQLYRPTMLILVGIAAGWRPKLRIGQVIWPRHVVAVAQIEVLKGRTTFRPNHHTPPAEVRQMLQCWKVNDAELAAHTDRIMAGDTLPDRERKDTRGPEVMYPPKAEECVIGCGDFLVRHDGHFNKLQKLDPEVRACEMECTGVVIALEDAAPGTAWLQIRGVSDFGDSQKEDTWQPYAAAAAGAFTRLFAEQCFDPELILGAKDGRTALAPAREAMVASRSVATSIPVEVVEAKPATAAILQNFETIRVAWKKGRELKTPDKLQALRATPEFRSATPESKAKILRFEAKVLLDTKHDVDGAAALAKGARDLVGEHRATEALVMARRSGPREAADLLANPTTLEEWNHRMGFLVQAKEADLVLTEWEHPPEGVGPDVESHRLRTFALLLKKRVADARAAFAKIGAQHQETFAIRLAGAVLDFYEAVSTAAPDRAFHLVPLPMPSGFIKRDEASMAALERAEAAFEKLAADVPEKNEFYYELQGWRLAAAAMNGRRRSEAEELCRALLEERPTDVQFLGWADACEFRIERDKNIAALAAELGVKLT